MYLCIYFIVHSIGEPSFLLLFSHRHFHFLSTSLAFITYIFFPWCYQWYSNIHVSGSFEYEAWQTRFLFCTLYSYLLSHTQFWVLNYWCCFPKKHNYFIYIKYGFVRVNVCPLQPSTYICHLCNVYISSSTETILFL